MLRSTSSALVCIGKNTNFQQQLALDVACRALSTGLTLHANQSYKLVIIGGGTGGCGAAHRLASKLGKGNVAIIEPSDLHYYQPMFTLIGGGFKKLEQASREMGSVLPKGVHWIRDSAVKFDPDNKRVHTGSGDQISYEYMVIAMGVALNFHLVPGLVEALEKDPMVCSNYSPKYVSKTSKAIHAFKEGNAIFTFPNTPVKCAGAPQKIAYLTDWHFRREGKRERAVVMYNTSLPVIFGVKKYAASLMDVVKEKGIQLNVRRNLVEVRSDKKEAVFENLDNPSEKITYQYEMLHATPPMSTPEVLRTCEKLVDQGGFLDINRNTLQHKKYPNIFGVGDCTNLPTAKTVAAISEQLRVLKKNLFLQMEGKALKPLYDGYSSCPLLVGFDKCILAEFDFDGEPLETFPFNQGKPMRFPFHLKRDFMPHLYWLALLTGYWDGPGRYRKLMHLGMGR